MHGQSPASPEGGRYLSRVGGGVVALGQTGERHPWIWRDNVSTGLSMQTSSTFTVRRLACSDRQQVDVNRLYPKTQLSWLAGSASRWFMILTGELVSL